MRIKKNQKRKKKSTKYKEINKILEDDWVTGVSHSLLVYPLSPTSSLIRSLEPASVLGGLHTVVDAAGVPGPTPNPQLLGVRSSLLQQHSPQGPWVPCAWLLCGGRKEYHQQAEVACSPYLCRLLDQKAYAGGAAIALPGERKRRLEAGTGGPGSSGQNTRATPRVLQYRGNIDA